jgi:cytochrome c biogenesis protein CcmG/thiol:disulfide interchange protein DsbE
MKFAFTILLTILLISLSTAGDDSNSQKKAPDFTLQDIEGSDYNLYENLEKGPVVINFWATWCVPCIEEMKKMKHLHQKYSGKDVQFLAISVDDPKTVGRVQSFVKSHRYPFTILLDTNNDVMKLLQGTVPPYTVLLDKNGNIVYSHVGYRMGDEKKLESELKKLLD